MSSLRQRDIVTPILVLAILALVSLAVVSGIASYFSVYNESINALRQQNRALINQIDGWISRKGTKVEYKAMVLRELGVDLDTALPHFASTALLSEDVSDVYMGFPDGTGFSGMGNVFPPGWVAYERPWYIAVAQRPGVVVFTPPYLNVAINELVFASARTIGNYDDSLGVVALDVPFSTVVDYIMTATGMAYSISFILDCYGYILMHPDPAHAPIDDFVFQNKNEVDGGRYAQMVATVASYGFFVGDGVIYIGSPLETTGWNVISRIPTSVVVDNVFWTLMGIGATVLFAVISVTGTWLVLRKVRAAVRREREAHEMNEIILNASPFIMNVWDSNINLVATSEQSVEMFGLQNQKQYIDRFQDLSPKYQPCGMTSAEKAVMYVKQAFTNGQVKFEWMHQTITGEPLPAEITIVRFRRQHRYFAAAYTVDLRPIKAAMRREKEAEERVKILLNASPMSCYLLDADRNAIDCNQAAIDLFVMEPGKQLVGTYPDQRSFERCQLVDCKHCGQIGRDTCLARQFLVGRFLDTFQNLEQKDEQFGQSFAGCYEKALSEGVQRFELSCVTLYGAEIPCEITIVPVGYQDGHGFAVYLRDLREHKQMLAEMQRRQTAEEESRAKTRFLARMSHEIRTPMNAVLGIAEIQLKKEKNHPPETEDAFSRIYSSSKLLLTIINDILDLSKVEAGKMEILPAVYDTTKLIEDTVRLNLIYFDAGKLGFSLEVDEKLPASFVGDELRIKQILNNLLSNAFKYTQEGHVALSFGVEESREDGEVKLVFRVRDTGQGMTKEQLECLFDIEFTRFNMQENRGIEGSGLGMSITYSLIKMMNGEIAVESALGKGSTFTVRLPQKTEGDEVLGRETVDGLQKLEVTQENQEKKTDTFTLEPMPYGRVLVVDDVDINLYVAEGILMAYEINVETAGSGAEALEKIKSGEVYDIIFMDHMMPGMDGIETTKAIRELGYTHPIVALTANAIKDSVEMFMKNGFSGFISKPIEIDNLDVYLARFIRDKHAGEASGD